PPRPVRNLLLAADKDHRTQVLVPVRLQSTDSPSAVRCLPKCFIERSVVQPDVRRIARPGLFVKSYRLPGVSRSRSEPGFGFPGVFSIMTMRVECHSRE